MDQFIWLPKVYDSLGNGKSDKNYTQLMTIVMTIFLIIIIISGSHLAVCH